MRNRALIVVGSLMLLLVACVVAWTTTRSAGSLKIAVAFAGYTNDASGTRLAVFQVTNASEVRIRLWEVYHVEVRGDAQRHGPLFDGRNAFVAPGQSTVFALPAYTNQVAWRAVLHCSRDGWRLYFATHLPPYRFVPRQFRNIPVEFAWSDWIER